MGLSEQLFLDHIGQTSTYDSHGEVLVELLDEPTRWKKAILAFAERQVLAKSRRQQAP